MLVTNNYFLRRLRYTFNFNDTKMLELWALADMSVTLEQVSSWLKKDDDPSCINCSDRMLAIFLNGLINDFRGKKDGPQMEPESRLNNNIILRKLKIALNLRDDDICELINTGGDFIGKSELSAFFRRVGHQHYRELQDQLMRKFMQGLQAKYRRPNQQTKNTIHRKVNNENTKQLHQEKVISPQNTSIKSKIAKETNTTQTINSHIWGKK
jgi:uncharacterized protein YehS (DUF1456 family)